MIAVAPECFPRSLGIKIKEIRCHNHYQTGNTRGNQIGQIIELGSTASKIKIRVIFITNHGIHSIDAFIQKGQRSAADKHIEHRSDDAVGSIFRNGFYCTLSHLCSIKFFCITPNDP